MTGVTSVEQCAQMADSYTNGYNFSFNSATLICVLIDQNPPEGRPLEACDSSVTVGQRSTAQCFVSDQCHGEQ